MSQVQTDDAGRFQLEDIPPGRYYIVAGRLDLPTFYPGVREIGAAKTIEVRAAATIRNIDFEVIESKPAVASVNPGVSVKGRVVLKNNPNAPMPAGLTFQILAQRLQVQVQGLPRVFTSTTAAVARDGSFAVMLRAGDQVSDLGLPDGYSLVSLTSRGRNLLTESIDVQPGAELLITVDVGDLRPRYRLMALVREDSSERPLAGERVELVHSSGEVLQLTVNPHGVVTFPRVLPGTYVVRLTSGGFDATEKQVVITDGSVQVELRARKKH